MYPYSIVSLVMTPRSINCWAIIMLNSDSKVFRMVIDIIIEFTHWDIVSNPYTHQVLMNIEWYDATDYFQIHECKESGFPNKKEFDNLFHCISWDLVKSYQWFFARVFGLVNSSLSQVHLVKVYNVCWQPRVSYSTPTLLTQQGLEILSMRGRC